jgi:transposase
MAYREIGMWEILEVLRRVGHGERQRAIQRVRGHSRSSIRRWLRAARRLGWEPGGGEPDEALARAVAQRLRPVREVPELGESEARLRPHRERIEAYQDAEQRQLDPWARTGTRERAGAPRRRRRGRRARLSC